MKPDKRKLYSKISIVLFVLSIVSFLTAVLIFLFSVATKNSLKPVDAISFRSYSWILFAFLPVPIASVVFGFYSGTKGMSYKKNIIIGFVMSGLLTTLGLLALIEKTITVRPTYITFS